MMVENLSRERRLTAVAMLVVAVSMIAGGPLFGGQPDIAPQTAHFIVILRFQRQTFRQDATPDEEKTVHVHLQYLKDLLAKGTIVYAGFRKDGVDGIVVLETASRQEAEKLVENDPAVKARLFAWELHDFKTVLIRGERRAGGSMDRDARVYSR